MRIRAAAVEDIAQIMALERLPEFRTFVGRWSEDEHRSAMADPAVRYFVAESDSELAGFAILRGVESENRSIEVKRIVVRSPGQGTGRRMLRWLLDKAFLEYGAHRVWLDVFEENSRAQHVYASLGFQPEGLLREAIWRDGAFHSLVLMSVLDREYRARTPGLPD